MAIKLDNITGMIDDLSVKSFSDSKKSSKVESKGQKAEESYNSVVDSYKNINKDIGVKNNNKKEDFTYVKDSKKNVPNNETAFQEFVKKLNTDASKKGRVYETAFQEFVKETNTEASKKGRAYEKAFQEFIKEANTEASKKGKFSESFGNKSFIMTGASVLSSTHAGLLNLVGKLFVPFEWLSWGAAKVGTFVTGGEQKIVDDFFGDLTNKTSNVGTNMKNAFFETSMGKKVDEMSFIKNDSMASKVMTTGTEMVGSVLISFIPFVGQLSTVSKVSTGVSAASTAAKMASGAKTASLGLSLFQGFGAGVSESTKENSDFSKATGAGILTGVLQALETKVGLKVAATGGNEALSSLLRVSTDSAIGAGDSLAMTGIETLFNGKSYKQNFKENGGWGSVTSNALFGGILSTIGEASQLRNKYKMTSDNVKNNIKQPETYIKEMPRTNIPKTNMDINVNAAKPTSVSFADNIKKKIKDLFGFNEINKTQAKPTNVRSGNNPNESNLGIKNSEINRPEGNPNNSKGFSNFHSTRLSDKGIQMRQIDDFINSQVKGDLFNSDMYSSYIRTTGNPKKNISVARNQLLKYRDKCNIVYWQGSKRISPYDLDFDLHDASKLSFMNFETGKKINPDDYPLQNSYKIYMPVVDDNISIRNADIVLDYLIKKNIASDSKISKGTRDDGFCIRVYNIDDAKNVINFINNNREIKVNKTGLPFAMKNGKVSLAMDGLMSYSDKTTKVFSSYLKNHKGNASRQGFKNYVDKIMEDSLVNGNYDNLYGIMYKPTDRAKNIENLLANYIQILQTLSSSLDDNSTIDDYFKICSDNQDKKKFNGLISQIKSSL